ncbi:hypothetical protein ACFVWF_28970 [Rhodococcus qingshengii]|uniref:hypothetical protein n=1 Tax=Rhodococcus qingshengii TaxID=334542 RepID=UPI0036D89B92
MLSSEVEQSFQNPLDVALTAWFSTFDDNPPSGLAHLSSEERRVFAGVVSIWQGMLDPNGQGINHCAHTSYMVRNILRSTFGIDSDPLTVTVDLTTMAGETVTLGHRNPRIRRQPSGYQSWTGHEIVYIPAWSLALDLTIGQISLLQKNLAGVLVDPVTEKLTEAPRLGTKFTTTVLASGGAPFADATYTICRPNYSYRDVQLWAAQQAELDQGVERAAAVLQAAGLTSA